MAGIGAWIVFLELATASLSNFASRKLCHAGCGLGMLAFDYRDTRAKLFVWAVAVSSTLMTWGLSPLPPFRFAQMRDVGVTIYLSVVAAWFFFELPTPVRRGFLRRAGRQFSPWDKNQQACPNFNSAIRAT